MRLPALVEPGGPLTPAETQRYSRHLLIPEIGIDGQRRLKNARVLCVGAGGLGSPALMYLAAAGVGTIGIVEFDTVDVSNLQRQIIHGESDIGRPKAESARDRVREINPHVNVVLHQQRLDASNALELFTDYDLIVDGTDNFATRYLINDACVLLGKPYVWGSIYRFDGQASVFWSTHGPCYRCVFPTPPPAGSVPSCAEGGVLGVACASIASIQVTEAVKLIVGFGDSLLGRLVVFDATSMEYQQLPVRKNPSCAVCGEHPTVTELIDYELFCGIAPAPAADASAIDAATLRDRLAARERGEDDFLLIDVREPGEFDIVRIPGSVLTPKDEFLVGDATAHLPAGARIVLHCKSGKRSADVLAHLHAQGFVDAVHLDGGILAWIRDVDPSLPTY